MSKRIALGLAGLAAVLAGGAWLGVGSVLAGRAISLSPAIKAGDMAVPASRRPSATGRPALARHASTPGPAMGAAAGGAGGSSSASSRPLTGKTIGIDPGHNGLNYTDPSYINHLIWNGRQWEACDTTGTQTNAGYTEPRFTFRVARFLRADLIAAGARVVMTRPGNHGVGPCVNRRSRILNRGHAMVSVDIHGDGGPSWGRGFSILEPVSDGPNNKVIRSSERLGRDVKAALLAGTPMPVSDYYGSRGFAFRNDLAGLNLTTEPKVLIECGNMRNARDARLMTSTRFQKQLAKALERAIIRFLG